MRRHRAGHGRAGPADQRTAGIVNLGAEGMMLVAAIAGFATAVHTGNDWLAFAAGRRWPARCMAAAFGWPCW
jgi:ABC-type uncharacterized transport system permease subunit